MTFEWDPAKDRLNRWKHGIGFADVIEVFGGWTFGHEDTRRDYGESRFVVWGRTRGTVYAIVYTRRSPNIRLISARRAKGKEIRRYEEAYKER